MDGFDADRASWIIVAAYAVSFLLVVLAWRKSDATRARLFWALLATALFALGANKQLDLQTHLTAFARQLARDGGWFAYRRQVQAVAIIGLGAAMLMMTLWLGWMVRYMHRPVKIALAGLLLLLGFVLLRAASFHHVDVLLRTSILGTRAWVMIELGGILIVMAGAALATSRSYHAPQSARASLEHRLGDNQTRL